MHKGKKNRKRQKRKFSSSSSSTFFIDHLHRKPINFVLLHQSMFSIDPLPLVVQIPTVTKVIMASASMPPLSRLTSNLHLLVFLDSPSPGLMIPTLLQVLNLKRTQLSLNYEGMASSSNIKKYPRRLYEEGNLL